MHVTRLDTVVVRYLLDRGWDSVYAESDARSDADWAGVTETRSALLAHLNRLWGRSPYQCHSITAPVRDQLEIKVEFKNFWAAQQFRNLVTEELMAGIEEFLAQQKVL